jgi:hypothetical protein
MTINYRGCLCKRYNIEIFKALGGSVEQISGRQRQKSTGFTSGLK